MPEQTPLISIVIPVKNGDAWLDDTIPAILRQTLADQTEIIVIDSGSTDRTLEILAQYPVNIISIPPSEFNHGLTRNLGVQHTKGEFIVMTVQDAIPSDPDWLQNLLDGFDAENVGGVCGQQIVTHDTDKNPVDWFRPISKPGKTKVEFKDVNEYASLPADIRRNYCRWDNVNAMYRRKALLAVPFRPLSFAEDAVWANDALLAGYALVYNTLARVNHYHLDLPEYTLKRAFTVYYHTYKLFGTTPSQMNGEAISILKNIKLLIKEKKIAWKDKWKWLLFNHRIRRSLNRSAKIFNRALAIGEAELDRIHTELCGIPPQAIKPLKIQTH